MLTITVPGHGLGTTPPGSVGGGFGVTRVSAVTFTTCLLWMKLRDMKGDPLEGVRLRVEASESQKVNTSYLRAVDAVDVETNELGYAEVKVIEGTVVKVTCRSIRKAAFNVNTEGQTSINLADYCA